MNLTRERVRQIELRVREKLAPHGEALRFLVAEEPARMDPRGVGVTVGRWAPDVGGVDWGDEWGEEETTMAWHGLTQRDVNDLTWFFRDAMTLVSGLRSHALVRGTASESERLPFDALWWQQLDVMLAAEQERDMLAIRRRMLESPDGATHWGVLALYFGPVERVVPGDFGDVAMLAPYTRSARARGERRFSRWRLEELERLRLAYRQRYPRQSGAAVQAVLRADALMPEEPTRAQVDELTLVALHENARAKTRDRAFETDVRLEAREMVKAAAAAYRPAARAVREELAAEAERKRRAFCGQAA